MPNYPTHARWGRIGAVTMALTVGIALFLTFEAVLVAGGAAVGALAATFVGAIYPDVDHHNSIPRRKAVRGFQVLAALAVLGLSVLFWDGLVALVATAESTLLSDGLPVPTEMAASWVPLIGALVVATLVDPLIGLVTRRHRGWTHSVPINLAIIGVLVGGTWLVTTGLPTAQRVAAVAVIGTFFVGTLIHLGLDGEII